MGQFFHDNLEHVLFALLLIARLGDIGSTFLISPELKLEANPIARRLGWRFIVPSLLICIVPYLSTPVAVGILAPSLFISASNIGKLWMVRAMGEEGYLDHLTRIAAGTRLRQALFPLWAMALFTMLAGATLIFLSASPPNQLAAWFGFGIVLYGIVQMLYGTLAFRRIFKRAEGDS